MTYVDEVAERAVIASAMLDGRVIPMLRTIVTPAHFGEPRHAEVWRAVIAVTDAGRPVDVLTLVAELRERGRLNTIGGAQYLGEITDDIPTVAHCETHARLVVELAAARDASARAVEMLAAAKGGLAPRDLIARLHQIAATIPASADGTGRAYDAASHAAAAWDGIMAAQGGAVCPARFGVESLDGDREQGFEGALGGLFPEQLIFLGAEPGAGKTTLADQAACETARTGRKVLVFPTEMSGPELARRRAATACGISQARMRGGLLSPTELSMLADALNAHAELPIDTIDDVHTVEGIRARVLAEAARADVGLVVVDYFQMLQSAEDGRDENVNTAARWNALKRVARDARVPMLVVSSLTKGGQRNAREKGSPEQTDARGSGPEYAADVMLFLTCENPTDSVREVIVHVRKNRQGPLGPVSLVFDAPRGRFRGKSYERLPESDDGDDYGGLTARGGDAE